jgi:uncharacterized radical SAM superfamily Fe-S cluster-containing enzyme
MNSRVEILQQTQIEDETGMYRATVALCSTCGERIDARLVQKVGKVLLSKTCPNHGIHEELFEDDVAFFEKQSEYDKPSTPTPKETQTTRGCPYDCGLCPEHNQHTCIALLEITERCDYGCPICYANAGNGEDLDLETATQMLDHVIEAEGGQLDILQISGGEPTQHPDILKFIELADSKSIRYIMLNTNGARVATDPEFVKQLARYRGKFELYLQFDGVNPEASKRLRGKDTTETTYRALDRIAAHGLPATLVVTVAKGINEKDLGKIVDFATNHPAVRGINFQPLTFFGRASRDDSTQRITRTGVIQELEKQSQGMLLTTDFIALPCDVHNVAITMLLKQKGKWQPITRKVDAREHLPVIDNTLCFYAQDVIKEAVTTPCCCFKLFKDGLPFLGTALKGFTAKDRTQFANENTLRITVTQFRDRFNFEQQAIQKECVHVLTPDMQRVPFSVYNLLRRNS